MIAALLKLKRMDQMGRFSPGVPEEGIPLTDGENAIRLTKRDVDIFQRAKAAIGTGIRVLLTMAGISAADLGCLYIAGAFGSYLNVANAQQIGLIPGIIQESADKGEPFDLLHLDQQMPEMDDYITKPINPEELYHAVIKAA